MNDLAARLVPDLAPSGVLFLACRSFCSFKGRAHDLILEWRRRDGLWDRDAIGNTPTLVSSLHEFSISGGDNGDIVAEGRIDPDPWTVVGGPLRLRIDPSARAYDGEFNSQAVHGQVECRFEPQPPASRGVSTVRPAILDEFERLGSAGRLYDFAYAGRDTTDPTVGLIVFDARDFGLAADSGREALDSIQRAIDAAGAAGGGVVQLPPGVLDCNVDRKLPPLRIPHDRVILRGCGSGPDGTLLVNHRYSDTPEPDKPWRAGEHPLIIVGRDDAPEPRPLARVLDGSRGDRWIRLDSPNVVRAGDCCLLRQLELEDGSLARDLVQGRVEVARNWRGAGVELVSQIVRISAVEADRVQIDAPLHRGIGPWPAQLCAFPMTRGSGVASLRMRGLWGGYFVHHKNGEHDNGWDQVSFLRVCGGWADDLVHENTTKAVGVKDCLGCVVRDCRVIGNPGHNAFIIGGRSTGNLFLRCHAGRNMHGFNVQGTICGNAVVDCSMDEPSGIDLHGGIGCDNLFDALLGGVNKGGGSAGAVPPRHGPGMVLWNWCCGHYDPYKTWRRYDVAADHQTTPGFIAVGVHGAYGQRILFAGPDGVVFAAQDQPWGLIESPGQRTAPRSLWAWQRDRAGRK